MSCPYHFGPRFEHAGEGASVGLRNQNSWQMQSLQAPRASAAAFGGVGAICKRSKERRIACCRGFSTSRAQNQRRTLSPKPAPGFPSDFQTAALVLRLWNVRNTADASSSDGVEKLKVQGRRAISPAATESLQQEEAVTSTPFNWATNWYPVIPVADFDTAVPYPFHILGRKVVFWCDKDGKFNCVLDACPHRLAPLSEGRVNEEGCLQCSYHGWSFRGDGSCAKIPQAKSDGPEVRACEQKKSRAVTLPVVVRQGIVFVWPDENSAELANKTEPPITPCVDGEGWCAVETFRDLPYGYDTGMENLCDPSHIPVAHHNVNGGILGKRSEATWLDLEVQREGPYGFYAVMKKTSGPPSIHTFDAPARFAYEYELKKIKDARAATTTYCVPTSPGNCRIIVVNARNFMIGLSSGPNWWQFFPRWLDHQLMLNLLDGDASLLHEQERYLSERVGGKPETWPKAYFMPTTADRYVGSFRTWLTRYAGKKIGWFPGVDESCPPLITKKEDLLNRYTTHTQYCRHCRKALENFQLARKVLFMLAVATLAVGAALSDPSHRLKVAVFSVISAGLGWWLGGWIQMFYYKGYDHARIP